MMINKSFDLHSIQHFMQSIKSYPRRHFINASGQFVGSDVDVSWSTEADDTQITIYDDAINQLSRVDERLSE